ncbi:uncharacterized protein [Chironomus tepperi]|uniref:uncharacterized protein n=1 Tax=Chironomus tepperi TaxID=113505 RepID=UPI00391F6A24
MEEIIELLATKQYIIISDEVGKGKSTLMTYLAYQFLHSTLPHIKGKFFVVKINLHQHTNEIERFEEGKNIEEFIFDSFVKSSNFEELEWKVFEEYYQNGRFILMLDGFDEIASRYEVQTSNFIQKALDSKLSNVIIATRPSALRILESSNAFILNIMPILQSDQKIFLTNYFKSQNSISNTFLEFELDELITKIFNKLSNSIRENFANFRNGNIMFSSPLHLKMFADVIFQKILKNKCNFEDAINSIIRLNMYQIYDEFIQNKFTIAQEDKGDVVKSEIKNLERRGFKRLDFYKCVRKLAFNTVHPAFKDNPLNIDEREKELMQYYGVILIQNNEIHFIHRSYAEFFIAHLFLEELIDGNISSNFEKEHFLVSLLTDINYEVIKGFIDKALSDKELYDKISTESFQCLGKFIIKEFEILEGNDKNFLHCVFHHELNERLRREPRQDFVFLSHLMMQSLMCCNDEEDVNVIKSILELPWDINNIPDHLKPDDYQYMYTMETGKNLFHLTCELGLNCLLSAVWELAENVFKDDSKMYFLTTSSTSPYDSNYNAVMYAFRRIERNRGKFNLQKCLTIDKLRNSNNINILEEINLSGIDNFNLTSLFCYLIV